MCTVVLVLLILRWDIKMKISGKRLLHYMHKLEMDHKLNKKDKRINTKSVRVRIRLFHISERYGCGIRELP